MGAKPEKEYKWLYDRNDEQASRDLDQLYDEVRSLLVAPNRGQPYLLGTLSEEEKDMSIFIRWRLKGYTSRDIAAVIVDAVLSERNCNMGLERR